MSKNNYNKIKILYETLFHKYSFNTPWSTDKLDTSVEQFNVMKTKIKATCAKLHKYKIKFNNFK